MIRALGPVRPFKLPRAKLAGGRVRTPRRIGRHGQSYPPAGPAEWIERGQKSVYVLCIARDCRHGKHIPLTAFPSDKTWAEIGRAMVCEACGEPGAVNISPNWHDCVIEWRHVSAEMRGQGARKD